MRSTFTEGTSGRTRGCLLAAARSLFRRSRDSGNPIVDVVVVVVLVVVPLATATVDDAAADDDDDVGAMLPLLLLVFVPRKAPNRDVFLACFEELSVDAAIAYCWCSCSKCTGAARSLSAESAELSIATTTNPSPRCT